MSTIAAIATGPGAGGVGIIRISGPLALAAARRVVPSLPAAPVPRRALLARLTDGAGAVLDEGLVLHFPAPHSFTGDDVVELHAHGAPRLLRLLLDVVLQEPGVRTATAGEFTRRAFLAGRLSLTRAEAVADLITAESEAQVRAAAAQLTGEFSRRVEQLAQPLLALQADVEGVLDFPEEAEDADGEVGPRLEALGANARALLADARRGALVRRGARVVLYGPVNAGKSTLFNALVGADRALVDAEPGTTRDTLEARLELGGLAVTVVDTAGLRAEAGRIEALGIARAREALRGADLAVLVVPPGDVQDLESWRAEVESARRLEVRGKADLAVPLDGVLAVSGLTGRGVGPLRDVLLERLGGSASGVISSSARHVEALELVDAALERARTAAAVSTLEVVAGEVGVAVHALAEVLGQDASTQLLDAIFARFCIGK